MSTWLYLECTEHDPPIRSESEVGQHLYDLPRIREWLTDRAGLVDTFKDRLIYTGYVGPEDYFGRHAAQFFMKHPHCRILIRDEYGSVHYIEQGDE